MSMRSLNVLLQVLLLDVRLVTPSIATSERPLIGM